ncbi:MAG TPA: serine/threonine-protein kinase [Thermoanaerobaculia bacterium]|nr:serine/threonine-protein kinase [Thermoanaerobaculia bacterium]
MTAPERTCPRCAAPLAAAARFCPSCGLGLSRLSPGEVLDGKYEILDKIGEGGMGEVYRARHLHLDEIRIIKVTKPDSSGAPAQPRRFQEEARLATLVRHPNVAALYDFSRQPDGSFYMVWEFIDGVTLERWLASRGPLAPDRALDVARQVLAGLAEIHAQGIVHRDLSPDNIMLRETSGGRLQAKIIDLGIAKRVASESLQMTGTGLFLGKLKYCSPEQAGALPSGQSVDARTDLYSFGVVLYEMLAGKAPFESATPEGYIGKHLHPAPPPLDVGGLPRELGAGLAAAVAKALEKNRDRRFRDAADFAAALARLPTAPLAAGAGARSDPRERRPTARGRWTVAAVLVLAAAAGGYALWKRDARPARPRRVAALPTAARPSPTPVEPLAEPAVPAPPAPAVGGGVPTPPHPAGAEAGLPPAQARQLIELWKGRPNEPRARRAVEIARMANRFVDAHPEDPLSDEIEESLPPYLKSQAMASLDAAEPLLAVLYYRAYKQLDFAREDPELARRFEKVAPPE